MFEQNPVPATPIEKKKTSQERRLERIQKLKNRIQRESNLLATQERKTRNSQLISWGIMVETAFRRGTPEQRQAIRDMAKKNITDTRNLSRIFIGFERVLREETQAEAMHGEEEGKE